MPEHSQSEEGAEHLPAAAAFELRTKPGGANYGECAGMYRLSQDDSLLNGKPVYVSDETENFLGFNGSQWVITSLAQKDRIVKQQKKGFKGFHAGGSGEPDDHDWGQFLVRRRPVEEVAPQPDAIVRIQGLVSAQDLNGAEGTCQYLDVVSNRWAVRLHTGDVRLIKAENLLVRRAPPAESRSPHVASGPGEEPPPLPKEKPSAARAALALESTGAEGTRSQAAASPAGAALPFAAPPLETAPLVEAPPAPVPVPATAARSVAPGLAARMGAAAARGEQAEAASLRAELEEVREAKREAAAAEDFQRAKELRSRELKLETQLQETEVPRASGLAAGPGKLAQPTGELQVLDSEAEASSAARAEMAGEVARLYQERTELAARRQRAAEGGEDGTSVEDFRKQEEVVAGGNAAAEAAALAGLAAEVSALRNELEALQVERLRAWRAEEEERVAELDQRRRRLEAKLQRLQVAAERAEAAAEAAPPRAARGRQSVGPEVGAQVSGDGSSLMRKLQQRGSAARSRCASCGAAAEPRASPDGLGYCSWCWRWWDSQPPSAEVAAPVYIAPVGTRERAGCFWDQRDASAGVEGPSQPAARRLVTHGASASGAGMRLLAAAPNLAGPIITEEEVANIRGELPREGEDTEKGST